VRRERSDLIPHKIIGTRHFLRAGERLTRELDRTN